MTLISIIILILLVITLCVCSYFLGRLDATLARLKSILPPPPKK